MTKNPMVRRHPKTENTISRLFLYAVLDWIFGSRREREGVKERQGHTEMWSAAFFSVLLFRHGGYMCKNISSLSLCKKNLHPWSATAEMEREVKNDRMEESEETYREMAPGSM
jgi:hypothetical protein